MSIFSIRMPNLNQITQVCGGSDAGQSTGRGTAMLQLDSHSSSTSLIYGVHTMDIRLFTYSTLFEGTI
jgi:hypothetical protein